MPAGKDLGLDPDAVDVASMCAVLTRLMPHELASRKIAAAGRIGAGLVMGLKAASLLQAAATQPSPEDVFLRVFGGETSGGGGNGKNGPGDE